MKLKILPIIFFCILLTQSQEILCQELTNNPIPSNSSGEEHSSLSDIMRNIAKQNGERLIVIVRLGDGETSRRVTIARIQAAKNYFLVGDNFKVPIPIFAEGERVKGEGRFEYYLGSRLQFVALAPKNKIINFTCCDDYFPILKKKSKLKKSNN